MEMRRDSVLLALAARYCVCLKAQGREGAEGAVRGWAAASGRGGR